MSKTPCGRNMGHGISCVENYLCDQCAYIRKLETGGNKRTALDDIMSLKNFVKRYPDLATEQQVRWAIFQREHNGLRKSGAILKRGGRIFIVVPKYREWLLQSEFD